jgi:cell division protein DivIC
MENFSNIENTEKPRLRRGLSKRTPLEGRPLNLIPAWLKNKYFLSVSAFIVWILFFDPRDVFTQMQHRRELRELQVSKAWYQKEISKESIEAEQLKSNPAIIEKYARENYLMKRENEDIFIIPEKPGVKNN